MEEFSVQRITLGEPDGEKAWVDAESAMAAAERICGSPVGQSSRALTDGFLVIRTADPYAKLWFFPVGKGQGSDWSRR